MFSIVASTFNFIQTTKSFPKVTETNYILTKNAWEFYWLHHITNIWYCQTLILVILRGM